MFSGYKQNQAFVYDILITVERFMSKTEGQDHTLDNLDSWDEGDLYRLVAAFLGGKFCWINIASFVY